MEIPISEKRVVLNQSRDFLPAIIINKQNDQVDLLGTVVTHLLQQTTKIYLYYFDILFVRLIWYLFYPHIFITWDLYAACKALSHSCVSIALWVMGHTNES